MTMELLATMLDGREYGNEITKEEVALAKQFGLVVVYGQSDDLMEFDGAFSDEVGCFEGGVAHLDATGIFEPERFCDCYDSYQPCKLLKEKMNACKTVRAVWCDEDKPCWTYQTEIPHVTFNVTEDGEVWCVGIVFRMESLVAPAAPEKVVNRGEWIHRDIAGEDPLECSECGNSVSVHCYDYCPYCGSPMNWRRQQK